MELLNDQGVQKIEGHNNIVKVAPIGIEDGDMFSKRCVVTMAS